MKKEKLIKAIFVKIYDVECRICDATWWERDGREKEVHVKIFLSKVSVNQKRRVLDEKDEKAKFLINVRSLAWNIHEQISGIIIIIRYKGH